MSRRPSPATTADWEHAVRAHLASHRDHPLKPRGLARALGISNEDYTAFRELLRGMLADGRLESGPGRTLALPAAPTGGLTGTLRLHRRGFAFVQCPGQPDLYVPRGHTGGALDGDTVAVRLLRTRPGERARAEVLRVLERAPIRWVGVLEYAGHHWFVQPHGRAPAPRVRIDDPTAKSTRPGDMVVVEPVESTLGTATVRGVIVERLGPPGRTLTKILSVIRRHGIPDEFPPEVRRAAQRAASAFRPADLGGRTDLRELLTITVDPRDARDFDDAISVQELPGGLVELGVHIADVSHFVHPGTVLDREALRRGNSAYFPGYVAPMLPEVLSNEVCSLQPGEPRFTKSAFILYDRRAAVVGTRFADSVIRSARRLTYEQVTDLLEGRPHALPPEIVQLLRQAEDLARRIRARRLAQGMIVLTLPEVEIQLSPEGQVIDAGPADTSFSHTIIEMFMVEANEAVSRVLTRAGLAHLRRIHPPPQESQPQRLNQLAALLGQRMPDRLDRAAIRRTLDLVRGTPAEAPVNLVLLQSMEQAVYSPAAEGHFALASDDYCHFTSPIRRYSDLVNHRLLEDYLRKRAAGRRGRPPAPSASGLAELGQQTSAAERRAQQAERDAQALLLLDLMRTKLGEELPGVVSSVVSFGAFVQVLPYLAEGLIHISEFGPDTWEFDERHATFVGRRSGRVVAIGQTLRVRVAAIDDVRGELLLVPAAPGPIGQPRAKDQLARGRRREQEGVARGRSEGRRRGRAGRQAGSHRPPRRR